MANSSVTGPRRLLNAALYSWAGLRAVWRHEEAFRQEVLLCIILAPFGFWLGGTGVERALLIGSLMLVMIVEIINSSIEAVVDRVGLERHELSKRAKDAGSAAVMMALVNAGLVWLLILIH
ncbi:MAG: diacylglycerol kinase [Gammaproteobacteria bacterium]